MSAVVTAALEPVGEARVALESVEVEASLRSLLSEVTVTQTYRNLEAHNIEAVYTFPLPLDAVLLELELKLNGKTLRGVVQPRTLAQEAYEEAVDEGDSAVLLEEVQPGLFTVNLANLLPGETARIRFRYAQLHRWQGDRLRFHLPTTVAPRYGDPTAAGLAPHQVPETVLSAEHGFALTLRIEGALARAVFECPSHPVAVQDEPSARVLRLAGGTRLMDRDFVLVVREPAEALGAGLWAKDGEGIVVFAPFHPSREGDGVAGPRCVKLVVDCSGSMAGDSIAQVRRALEEILMLLRPSDWFNIIAFGSTARLLWPAAVPADRYHITGARDFVKALDANLGGTEIGRALEVAYGSGAPPGVATDLILITDGEVWDTEPVLAHAEHSEHRIFSVGVGSAVAEAFVRRIAERTGGACELVSPREAMAERIVRHFERILQPRARAVTITWPGTPMRQIPETCGAVYVGDTLHVFAWLPHPPKSRASLELTLEDGRVIRESIAFTPEASTRGSAWNTLPRLAAKARLVGLPAEEAQKLAVEYQLVTEATACVLVHEREAGEKAQTVPALRKVPQVQAAGWGGAGSLRCLLAGPENAEAASRIRFGHDLGAPRRADLAEASDGGPGLVGDYAAPPALRELLSDDALDFHLQSTANDPTRSTWRLVATLNTFYTDQSGGVLGSISLRMLTAAGLSERQVRELSHLVAGQVTEQDVAVAFLVVLLDTRVGQALSRHVQRLIRQAAKTVGITAPLQARVSALTTSWGVS